MREKRNNTIKKISKEIRPLCRLKSEEQITNIFIEWLIENHHVISYCFTHMQESINGCDWLWIITTNAGAFYFATQAKKLHYQSLRRRQVNYHRSNKHKPQIKRLMKFAIRIGALPIYVLYADKIDTIKGCPKGFKTKEGVFFDYAPHVNDLCINEALTKETPFPLSCMFSYIAQKCSYENKDENNALCVACNQCIMYDTCSDKKKGSEQIDQRCKMPFLPFFKSFYNTDLDNHNPANEGLLLLRFGKDILSKNKKYLSFAINTLLGEDHPLVRQIIVQDYMVKHDMNYAKAMMGEDFRIDDCSVLDPIEVEQKLKKLRDAFGIFRRIGFFGSYARYYYDRETEKKPGKDSDIDVVFEYDSSAFKSEADLLKIPAFIKEAFLAFHKNIDFIDYNTCDEQFGYSIRNKIRWIP